jgi:hypothetical protein
MQKVLGTVVLVFTVLLGACGSDDSSIDPSHTNVYDSAGVTIVDNGPLDAERALIAGTMPILQVGVVEGGVEYQLFRVADAKRLSDGGIAVANGGSRELRIYDPDGTHRATAGGAGQGPSEFRYPRSLVILPGDTIQVQDFMDRVYFAPDGAFLRRETGDQQALAAAWEAAGGTSEGGQWVADGTLFAPIYHWDQTPPKAGPMFRPPVTLVRVSADLTALDTLGDFGGILQQYLEVGGRRGVMPLVPPFSQNTSWSVGSADGTIVVGDNALPQINRFHPDGSRSIVRWTAIGAAITDAEVEEWKDRQRNEAWVKDQLPELERGWAALDMPETKPFYGRVSSGSDGSLWVGQADYLAASTRLRAFDSHGEYVGTVEIPGTFSPFDSGPGWILGLMRGENDVEYLQVYELRKQ